MSTNPGDGDEALAQLAVQDPRGRSEAEWLDILSLLLRRLEVFVGAHVELGGYGFDHGPASRELGCGALSAQVRAAGPLPGTASDGWEGVLCITGGERGTGVDVIAFPFLRESLLTREGRLAELEQEWEVEEFWVTFADGAWQTRGWVHADGAGEWSGIRGPGDMFGRVLRGRLSEAADPSAPPVITLEDMLHRPTELGDRAWFSLHRLWRDGDEVVAPRLPSSNELGGHGPLQAPAASRALPTSLALSRIQVPGGWVPGRYRAEVRLSYTPGPAQHESILSTPIEFEVA